VQNAAILIVMNDTDEGHYEDTVSPVISSLLSKAGFQVKYSRMVPAQFKEIVLALQTWTEHDSDINLIVTTGGIGLTRHDITPEATCSVVEKQVPGIAEVIRAEVIKFDPRAMLSRGIAGVKGRTLIINLPGNPRRAQDGLSAIIPILNPTLLMQE
jgi:molybdopterin adenylyltransferase